MAAIVISVRGITMRFGGGGRAVDVLSDVSLDVPARQFLAVAGPSGSGKSTLLGLIAGLDRPTAGQITVAGVPVTALGEAGLARFRRDTIGYVFQSFHLIPTLTARENIQVPLELRGLEAQARADELLRRVGLADRGHHYPAQLSGGEQQRVALARAFSHRPRVLFADEPTGNLDGATGARVIELMSELNREAGTTLVLVTHDQTLAARAHRIVRLSDGALQSDSAAA